jgi:hypothetical protein
MTDVHPFVSEFSDKKHQQFLIAGLQHNRVHYIEVIVAGQPDGVYLYIYIYIYIYIYTHTHTHARTHAHTRAHTRTRCVYRNINNFYCFIWRVS